MDHQRSPSPGADDDKASQADDEDVSGGIYESGRWYGNAASGSVAAPAMLEKVRSKHELSHLAVHSCVASTHGRFQDT
jgi:hypothetical protein